MIIAILVMMVLVCVRFTGFVIRMVGKILGGTLGILGFLLVGVIAMALLRTAFKIIPIMLAVGLIVIAVQSVKDNAHKAA
ncbi:MAG: hypothetical protein IJL78_11270 [Lachnospiraceae bacterium]|nr:hypothetical protein [Lachnospiraceae bacterium]